MRLVRMFRSVLLVASLSSPLAQAEPVLVETSVSLPEFTHRSANAWLNSEPLTVADLRGKVALVHVWTFECWNCYRSFPWLADVAKKYSGRNVVEIGIHTPEFEREKVPATIAAKTKEFGIDHPVMIDNDLSYWRALDNRFWPAWYIVDSRGVIRARVIGEIHAGDPRARAVEETIDELLAERDVGAN